MVAPPRPDARVFAALGDATRLELLARLEDGALLSATHLAAKAPVSRQAVSKHLRVLADVGLVEDVWRGRERLWKLNPEPLHTVAAWIRPLISQQGPPKADPS
jgi:DNA-binding transcriptional ArsR family regulator